MSTDQHLINNDLGIPDEKRAYEIYMITKTWLNLTIIYFTKAYINSDLKKGKLLFYIH